MMFHRHIFPFFSVILAACTNAPMASENTPSFKPFSQRLNEKNGYTQDADGNWKAQGDKRSSFEKQGGSPHFQQEYQKNTYKTGEYAKKSWWGNKDYGHKNYDGNTDGSRFMTSSPLSGKNARESSSTANLPGDYPTQKFTTNSARESDIQNISKPSDAETDIRRGVYQQPDVIDWREQRKLSLDQSKGLLGR